MHRWPLRRRLWLLVALLCSVTLAVAVVSLVALKTEESEVAELADVTGPALSLNSAILQTMTDAETGLRGYVATGNPVLLEPYNGAERQSQVSLRRLNGLLDRLPLSAASPLVVPRQDAAQDAAIAGWWRYAARARVDGTRAQGGLLGGMDLFDQVRQANADLAGTLLADQRALRARAAQQVTFMLAALLALTTLALLGGLAAAGRLSRTVTGPIKRLRQVVLRQGEGADGVRADEDRGPLEIRDLAAAFNALAAHNTQLAAEQAETLRLQEEAFAAGRAIRFAVSVQEAMQITCAHIGDALRARRVTAFMLDQSPAIIDGAQWHLADLADLPDPGADWAPRLWGVAARLWAKGGQLAVDDLLAEDIQEQGWPVMLHRETGATAMLLAPAGLGDRVVGVVSAMMNNGPRAWTAAEVAVVQQVANFLARAIVQAEHDGQVTEYTSRLESLDRQKTEFLSTVSHELRTPLTSIQGYLELLRDGDAGPVDPDQRHMLDIIERNATRLRGLIEDILVLNRIESGGLTPGTVEVSLRGLTLHTAEELQPLADKAGVQLRVHVDEDHGPVIGDRTQLQRALVNILSNAIKFTHSGGTVTLACRTDPAGEIVITCQDTGIGIPKADLEHLFTRFFRASNATGMAIPGTGLGLAIVAAIVEVNHGRLALDSTEGKGTTITLRFSPAPAGVGA
jgi:two-component system, OmpR family, phosphate regulon sensor histidine kinase PhoR